MSGFKVGSAAALSFIGAMLAPTVPAQALSTCSAYPCVLGDSFNGGLVTYSHMTGDTVETPGTHDYEIQGAVITRPTATSLDIKIYTNFAGLSNTPAAAPNVTYGSVFFGSTASGDGSSDPGYTANQWSRAYVVAPYTPNTPTGVIQVTNGTGQLYNIGGNATPNVFDANGANPGNPNTGNVPNYYQTDNGKIYMSNVNGNPITFPNPGRVPFYFRQGQAVRYIPDDATANKIGTGGTWAVGADAGGGFAESSSAFLEFIFNDNGDLGDNFVLAWAMTCGNDAFQGVVAIPPGGGGNLPLPGAFALMGTVLFGAGGFAKWRNRRRPA